MRLQTDAMLRRFSLDSFITVKLQWTSCQTYFQTWNASGSSLCSGNLKAEHLLQPIAVLEDSYFAYFVTPLCEYNLMELIENKGFPERKVLTEHRRLEMCQELLQGLQELHSHGLLHRDLKPDKTSCLVRDLWISHRHDYPGICSCMLNKITLMYIIQIVECHQKCFYFFTDINNKMYIADFGASRKLSQTAGSLSWSSYEDVGDMQHKYKKESDIQVQ